MNLSPKHRDEWLASAVRHDIIERNVWSIDDSREVDELLNRNTKRKWKHSDDLVPGWAVAGVDVKTGERIYRGAQFKPDNTPLDTKTGKPRKYFSPSQDPLAPLFLEVESADYWQDNQNTPAVPIVITEGAKKAGAVLTAGYACISIPGVSTGGKHGRLKPELKSFCQYGRTIYLAFDRDIIQKKPVQQALHNLGRMLTAEGPMVHVLEWADAHKGIDDWLASLEPDAREASLSSAIASSKTLEEWKAEHDEGQGDTVDYDSACRLAKRYRRVEEKLTNRLRWNTLKGMVEMDGKPVELDNLRMYLALKHNVDIPFEECSQIVVYIAKQQSYNPVAEYLENVAKAYEADSALLDSLAQKYLGSDSELHSVYLRKTLIAAVARALRPGCKVDTVCILSGLQGVGKSTFWKILAGEDNFDDSIGSVSDKDERLKLHKSWMVEWAELETVFRRKDVSAVKAFLTTQIDQLRPPYGRTVQEFPRPSIIVGTTNLDNFLSDSTGNRRYWVIPISIEAVPLDELAKERDRIWAAAVHAYASGEHWGLPAELRAAAAEDAEQFGKTDPWEEVVLGYVELETTVTVTQVLSSALKLDLAQMDKRAEMRVADILKANGWKSGRRSVQGRKLRAWYSPSFYNKVGLGRSNGSETYIEQGGPTSDQPPDQPPGPTPHFDRDDVQGNFLSPERTDLPGPTGYFPKRGFIQDCDKCTYDQPLIKVGDRVRITIGRFDGAIAKIVTLDEKRSQAVVIADEWSSCKHYPLENLELVP